MSSPQLHMNSVLNSIHDLIQSSGLHFVIQQTPWSSYITLRKKFARPTAHDFNLKDKETVTINDLEAEKEKYKQLKEKLVQKEAELVKTEEEFRLGTKENKKTIANLQFKIDVLENALDKTKCDVKK